jgi:Oxidoreductase molybdopterin binding domain
VSSRLVNRALFIDTVMLLASGILLFTTNRSTDAWVYTLHRYAGVMLVVFLVPKIPIIARSLARRRRHPSGIDATTVAGILLSGLTLLSIGFVLAWTIGAAPNYIEILSYTTPLALHWYLAFALVPFFVWHAWKRWIPLPRLGRSFPPTLKPSPISRRTALQLLAAGSMALFGLGGLDILAAMSSWSRRFTGSRAVGLFRSDELPVTNSDGPPIIDIAAWRLKVSGRLVQELELDYADVKRLSGSTLDATLDCTLGWASTQNWRGVSVGRLLDEAGLQADARQVTCVGVTGASVVLSVEEARDALIATQIGTETLTEAHGFPARLVAPTRRGYHWIKWMSELAVN